jgi:hypothetical protein
MNKKCDEPRVREIVKEEMELNSWNEPMAKNIVEEVMAGEGKNLQTEHNEDMHYNTMIGTFCILKKNDVQCFSLPDLVGLLRGIRCTY